jgi:hypothetical protein
MVRNATGGPSPAGNDLTDSCLVELPIVERGLLLLVGVEYRGDTLGIGARSGMPAPTWRKR